MQMEPDTPVLDYISSEDSYYDADDYESMDESGNQGEQQATPDAGSGAPVAKKESAPQMNNDSEEEETQTEVADSQVANSQVAGRSESVTPVDTQPNAQQEPEDTNNLEFYV